MVVVSAVAALGAACGSMVDTAGEPTAPAEWQRAVEGSAEMLANYEVHELPSLPDGRWARAVAMNDHGLVVGAGDHNIRHFGCRDFSAAAAWQGGKVINLHYALVTWLGLGGNPPDLPTCTNGGSMAVDVNDQGDVLIMSSLFDGNTHYIWNARTGFRRAPYGGSNGGPVALNNQGQLAGYVDDNQSTRRAMRWQPRSGGVFLTTEDVSSTAFDISDDGIVVGCASGRLARWSGPDRPEQLPELCGEDMGILPGLLVRSIGGATRGGVAAVSAMRGNTPTPLVWRNGSVSEAGWGAGSASGINEHGRVVGWAYPGAFNDPRAVTRLRGGPVQWLPLPVPDTRSRAYAVDRCGNVAGYATAANGIQRAVIWRRLGGCDEHGVSR